MSAVEFACVGGLREDYALLPSGEARLRELGGSAVYAGAGAKVWVRAVGLVARVGTNYPAAWLAKLQERGLDTEGVKIVPGAQDTRAFYAYLSLEARAETDPAAQFARVGLPLPAELAGYVPPSGQLPDKDKFGPLTVRPGDVPLSYLHAHGFHFAPDEFVVHNTLPVMMRHQGISYLTCDPGQRYMQPPFADEVRHLVRGLDAFLPSEAEVRAFFAAAPGAPPIDLWQAAEAFGAMGTKVVVVKSGTRGQLVYDAEAKRKWHVPAYPAKAKDVTGAGDAYCGGFLVGLVQTHDPVEAAVRGAVSASIVIEGKGALYALDSTPGLAEARAQALRDLVRQI
jgi:sugar/nucleoside kinase (ribokinase family)